MTDEIVTVEHPAAEMVRANDVPQLLAQIRPQWQGKDLIQRVSRLLPVDPSSACQRLLNAAIRDLRDKIGIAGIDIAGKVADEYKLPAVTKQEDVESYTTHNVIQLAYRMGLLGMKDWRRMTRAYEIRRDLEHEDSEYEAGIEDVLYVFVTCIDAVLSKDPVTLIRVTDVKEIIETPSPVVAESQLLEDYEHAPDTRQLEIAKFLVSTALGEESPDLVRQNANSVMREFSRLTRNSVLIQLAAHVQDKLGYAPLNPFMVRVAHSAGILPYFKRAKRKDFFTSYADAMDRTGYRWHSNAQHGQLLQELHEFGGLDSVPDDLHGRYVKWLVLCFIGEPGGYGAGRSRTRCWPTAPSGLVQLSST